MLPIEPSGGDVPLHRDDPKEFLKTLQPIGQISDVKDIVDAIVYLALNPRIIRVSAESSPQPGRLSYAVSEYLFFRDQFVLRMSLHVFLHPF
jgi:hypothetical protein